MVGSGIQCCRRFAVGPCMMFMVVFNECVSSPYKYVGACPLPTRISCAFEIFNLYHVAQEFSVGGDGDVA